MTMASNSDDVVATTPSPINYILSFLLVGICWGFTTAFIRRAAKSYSPPTNSSITDPRRSWLSRQISKAFFTVIGLLRKPSYAIPLVANLTGSIWFFLLVGQAGRYSAHATYKVRPLTALRALTDGPNYQLIGFPLHGIGRVPGRREAYIERYLVWCLSCLCWHRTLCILEDIGHGCGCYLISYGPNPPSALSDFSASSGGTSQRSVASSTLPAPELQLNGH
jgi:hypothetical protein